ncbi:MAG: hypothetical protein H6Q15_2448 [Bacteroidetes bacterium]|nr:hypothetical protein [Bacteroidota bacterium]
MTVPSANNSIEQELGNENVQSEIPFNPNDISINIVPRTIGQLVDMLEYNEILVPKYQRLPNLWGEKKKSRFIESLMLNLPIPLFYFDEGDDKKWRVIDGLQRISTLEHYILGNKTNLIGGNKHPLRLQNLEFKTEFNDLLWEDLPKDVQRRILTNQVTINLIGKGTPDQVKYNIFSRINQGGIELTAQEIRSALFQGYRLDFLETLISHDTAAGKAFLKSTSESISSDRQEDLDFATRFTSFFLIGYEQYMPDMDSFLTLGTKAIPFSENGQNAIRDAFERSMLLAHEIFGKHTFRKIVDEKRRQINKPLFELISVYLAKMEPEKIKRLKQKKDHFLNQYIEMQNTPKFWASISTGTATKDSVKNRHEAFIRLIETI